TTLFRNSNLLDYKTCPLTQTIRRNGLFYFSYDNFQQVIVVKIFLGNILYLLCSHTIDDLRIVTVVIQIHVREIGGFKFVCMRKYVFETTQHYALQIIAYEIDFSLLRWTLTQ